MVKELMQNTRFPMLFKVEKFDVTGSGTPLISSEEIMGQKLTG